CWLQFSKLVWLVKVVYLTRDAGKRSLSSALGSTGVGFGTHQDPGYLLHKFRDDEVLASVFQSGLAGKGSVPNPSCWKAKLIQYLRAYRFGFWHSPRSWIFAVQIPG
ncbi:hypothetical protein, partial [Vibrio breoganii]|uniref:hypothetical protein n=1 Tax=Vibrio breoganii TaxID=553239 RepID=UPI001A7E17CB